MKKLRLQKINQVEQRRKQELEASTAERFRHDDNSTTRPPNKTHCPVTSRTVKSQFACHLSLRSDSSYCRKHLTIGPKRSTLEHSTFAIHHKNHIIV